MDENSQIGIPSCYYRLRSPTFKKEEVKVLLNLIDKYKNIVLNRSTSSAASYAKEKAWIKISKLFNSRNLGHERSTDCLKIKWDNVKKEARKLTNNFTNIRYDEYNEVNRQIVAMLCAAENFTSIHNIGETSILDDELEELAEQKESLNDSSKNWNVDEDFLFDDSPDGDSESKRLVDHPMNFSPQECKLLLQCVKQEKSIILSKISPIKKQQAWSRITNSYNKQSPKKRSVKNLQQKFTHMKTMAKKLNLKGFVKDVKRKKHEKLIEDNDQVKKKIKTELDIEFSGESELDDTADADCSDVNNGITDNNHIHFSRDPLSLVINSDPGIGSMEQSEYKEIVKLKLELLKYKMETAKLKRKRLEDLMQAEAAEREAKELEMSLRLRAARLEAAAAEARLPATHAARAFTAREAHAQNYLNQHHTTWYILLFSTNISLGFARLG